jgi:lipopolysaccharide biosynthesis regulator YciM
MNLRTFFSLLLIFLVASFLIILAALNTQKIMLDLHFWEFTGSFWLFLYIFLLAGFLSSVIWLLIRNSRLLFTNLREKRRQEKESKIRELYIRALEQLSEGSSEKALSTIEQILQEDKKNYRALLTGGDILRMLGRYEEAVNLHLSAQLIKPDEPRIILSLAEDYLEGGKPERAVSSLNPLLEKEEKEWQVPAYRKRRDIEIRRNRISEAQKISEKIVKLVRDDPKAKREEEKVLLGLEYQLTLVKLQQGKKKEAVSSFKKILKKNPGFVPAYIDLSKTYYEENEIKEAEKTIIDGFRATGNPLILRLVEEYLLSRENPTAAISLYQKALKEKPQDIPIKFYLARLYYKLEMIDEALSEASEIENRIEEHSPHIDLLLAELYSKRGEYKDAARILHSILEREELVNDRYHCRVCGKEYKSWHHQCSKCLNWNTIELILPRELASPRELIPPQAPVHPPRLD